jgi:DNA replication protein DnaC
MCFQLISTRYERASVIVTSNMPFGRWGEVFGDALVAAAKIDRLVHHAEVVNLKGNSSTTTPPVCSLPVWRCRNDRPAP